MIVVGQLSKYVEEKAGASAMVPIHMSDANDAQVVESQVSLIQACKTKGVPMILVAMEIFMPSQPPYTVQSGVEDSNIIQRLGSEASGGRCYSVTQKTGNVFADTDLETKIKSFGRWQIILAGGMADACVKATAVGAPGVPQEVTNGAVDRGFIVHTTSDVILGDLGTWPDTAPNVRCYTRY